MGDILFKAGKQVRLNTKDLSWIARDSDLTFGAARGSSTQNAPEGVDLLIGEVPEANANTLLPTVIDVYFAKQNEEQLEKVNHASIGDDVLLVIETSGLEGRVVVANIRDKDKIITPEESATLGVLQDGSYTEGLLKTTIDEKGQGIIKVKFRGNNDAVTGRWIQGIIQSGHKFARIKVLVDASHYDKSLQVQYDGNSKFWFDGDAAGFELHLPVCPVEANTRSHFVIHNTAGNMSEAAIISHTNADNPAKKRRSLAHKYVMSDGKVIEIWPFSETNVWATKIESHQNLKGQMFHVELNYLETPSDAHYTSLVDLYLEAVGVEGCWPIIVPHIEVDRGIANGHEDPTNFDYNKFYELLKAASVPIDIIPKFEHDRYWGAESYKVPWKTDKTTWPPVLSGNPHK